jgi:3-phenylpropionate/trans-cinnamate dioxygenase ferredoxin reductase subunit
VVAAGDCTARWSGRFGTRLRVEHWDEALHAPTAAVTTLLGVPRVHDPVPYFWSEQLGHRLQHVGHTTAGATVVHREGPEGLGVAWLHGDRLLAFLAVDRPRELAQARKRIGELVDRQRLADPAVPLKAV